MLLPIMRLQWGLPYIGLPSASNQGGAYLSTLSTGWTTVTFPIAFTQGSTPAAVVCHASGGDTKARNANTVNNISFLTQGEGANIHYLAIGH